MLRLSFTYKKSSGHLTFLRTKRYNPSSITAIVPCFNSSETLPKVLASLHRQTIPPYEILVIDDGSTDDTSTLAQEMQCRVIRFDKNYGRGHSRNVGILECKTPFALFCDSSNILPRNFSSIALKHFEEPSTSAVFGRIANHQEMNDVLSRWRARHLFKEHLDFCKDIHEVQSLISYAVLFRKDAVLAAGNFDRTLRKCEDQDIGEKLIRADFKIISDPSLVAYSIRLETMTSLTIRFNRWFSSHQKGFRRWNAFFNTLQSSIKIFFRDDCRRKDFRLMIISLSLPFWLLAVSFFKKKSLTS